MMLMREPSGIEPSMIGRASDTGLPMRSDMLRRYSSRWKEARKVGVAQAPLEDPLLDEVAHEVVPDRPVLGLVDLDALAGKAREDRALPRGPPPLRDPVIEDAKRLDELLLGLVAWLLWRLPHGEVA